MIEASRTLMKSEPELAALVAEVDAKLDSLRDVARGDGNLLHPIRAALKANASIGEVCGAMRDVFGEYKGGAFF